jgi:hypothetical protein
MEKSSEGREVARWAEGWPQVVMFGVAEATIRRWDLDP